MKIVIVNTRNLFGGTLVLSALCKTLIDLGYDARIFYVNDFPRPTTNMIVYWLKWCIFIIKRLLYVVIKRFSVAKSKYFAVFSNTPVPGLKEKILPFVNKRTIVVYPEVVYGNFLKAKVVVRWLLYYNRYKGDPRAFGRNDLVVSYRDVFNDEGLNPQKYIVKINYFDASLYRQFNFNKRSGCCYIIRKGRGRNDLPSIFSGPIIDDFDEETKVNILNHSQYCYLYDTQTFYAKIVAVCGCIPVVIPEEGKTQEDYLGPNHEILSYGIAYGNTPEQIYRAIDTRPLLLETLNYKESNEKNATYLMETVIKHFNLT